jgi:hypothetical protein
LSADKEFVNYLREEMYHPRSSAHGDKLCRLVLNDLLHSCSSFLNAAKHGKIVYKLNHVIDEGSPTQWNLDLVVGPPTTLSQSLLEGELIASGQPAEIWLAIDAKTVMTEHGKARRNRQRDLNSLHDILHRKDPKTIVGGLVVVNMAGRFKSPLRPEVTFHHNVESLVRKTIELFRGLPRSKDGKAGLDALGVIVVSHTNLNGDGTELITGDPAPQPGDTVHYSTFLHDVCAAFGERFPT